MSESEKVAAELSSRVTRAYAEGDDARSNKILSSLVKHLHEFVSDIKPTEEEWFQAIDFLTRTGQMCNEVRQEFILLSDTLGVSMLVDQINHSKMETVTETTVFGPFYRENSPHIDFGGCLIKLEEDAGEVTLVRGQVKNANGRPIVGATLDVWQNSPSAMYDVQDPNQPAYNMRGKLTSDENGDYAFTVYKPVSYPIPTDGPVGELLRKAERHPYRPAHIHFLVSASGHESIITHIFVEGDKYLDSDSVFAVKDSLVIPFIQCDNPEVAEEFKLKIPYALAEFDFELSENESA